MTLHNMYSILLYIPKLGLEVPKCSAPRQDPLSILNTNRQSIQNAIGVDVNHLEETFFLVIYILRSTSITTKKYKLWRII